MATGMVIRISSQLVSHVSRPRGLASSFSLSQVFLSKFINIYSAVDERIQATLEVPEPSFCRFLAENS